MAQVAGFTYIEDKAFEYAEAFRAAGFNTWVICSNDGMVSLFTEPRLPERLSIGLSLSESLPDLQGRC